MLKTLALLSVVSVACAADRPNIVWLSCEDISAHLGCYGDERAITPHLDQLAKEGVRYTHAYTTAGVCAPCRSGIITGMYQTTLGTHHMRSTAKLPKHIRAFPAYLREAGYYCSNNSKQDYQFKTPKDVWDESKRKAHWRRRKDKSQPFFSVFNFTGCHESGIAGEAKYKQVTKNLSPEQRQDPDKLTLPPYYPDTPIVREDWKRNYELITAMDAWAGDLIQQLKDDGLYENTIIMYWSDHGVGLPRAKRWLYESGTHIPLIARIPESLRTDGQGVPGTVDDQLISSIDFAPTVLHLLGLEIPAHMQGRAFLGSQLTPERKYVFGARDRMDERYDIIRMVRNKRFRYIRNYEPFKPYYQYMNTPEKGATMKEIRRVHAEGKLPAAAKLFMADSKPVEELYDVESDPHEINNIAADPQHAATLEELRKQHLDWVMQTRDLGLLPESEIERREVAAGSRFDILRGEGGAKLMWDLRKVSSQALEPDKYAKELRAALEHADPAVRFWGYIGIGNRTVWDTEPKSERELIDAFFLYRINLTVRQGKQADGFTGPCVRVALARALIKLKSDDSARELLKDALSSDNQWARLRAAIVLDEAGEVARPLVEDLKKCLTDQPNKYITRVANRALNKLLGADNVVP